MSSRTTYADLSSKVLEGLRATVTAAADITDWSPGLVDDAITPDAEALPSLLENEPSAGAVRAVHAQSAVEGLNAVARARSPPPAGSAPPTPSSTTA
jgi:hypothetical protein